MVVQRHLAKDPSSLSATSGWHTWLIITHDEQDCCTATNPQNKKTYANAYSRTIYADASFKLVAYGILGEFTISPVKSLSTPAFLERSGREATRAYLRCVTNVQALEGYVHGRASLFRLVSKPLDVCADPSPDPSHFWLPRAPTDQP